MGKSQLIDGFDEFFDSLDGATHTNDERTIKLATDPEFFFKWLGFEYIAQNMPKEHAKTFEKKGFDALQYELMKEFDKYLYIYELFCRYGSKTLITNAYCLWKALTIDTDWTIWLSYVEDISQSGFKWYSGMCQSPRVKPQIQEFKDSKDLCFVKFKNGSWHRVVNQNQAHGWRTKRIVGDECVLLRESTWDGIQGTAQFTPGVQMILMTTTHRMNWAKQLWDTNINNPDWLCKRVPACDYDFNYEAAQLAKIHDKYSRHYKVEWYKIALKCISNIRFSWITKEAIARARVATPHSDFMVRFMAEWYNLGVTVFKPESLTVCQQHGQPPDVIYDQVNISFDWGIKHPAACVITGLYRKKIHVLHFISQNNTPASDFTKMCLEEFISLKIKYNMIRIIAEGNGQRDESLACGYMTVKLIPEAAFYGGKTFSHHKVGEGSIDDYVNCYIPRANYLIDRYIVLFYVDRVDVAVLMAQFMNYIYINDTKEDGRWGRTKTIKTGDDGVDAALHNFFNYELINFEDEEFHLT